MAKKKKVQKRPASSYSKKTEEKVVEELELTKPVETKTDADKKVEEKKKTDSDKKTEEKKKIEKPKRETIGEKIKATRKEISLINWGEPKQVRTTLGAVIVYSIIGGIVMLITTQIAIKVAEAINSGMMPKAG